MTVESEQMTSPFQGIVQRRAVLEVARIDYRRELRKLLDAGYTQTAVARALRISQPAVSKAAKTLDSTPEPAPGFSGATPYEMCQRYGAGLIDREQLIDELSRWEYTPIPQGEWYEDVLVDPGPGSWLEVQHAADEGMIDGETYDEALQGSARQRRANAAA